MVVREHSKKISDEHAITKAAAWAWYERGSGFKHESIRETECRRTRDCTPRPSRYKLETMKKTSHEPTPYSSGSLLSTEGVHNRLLDVYEIERISSELDCYVESSRVEHRRRSMDSSNHGGRMTVSLVEGDDKSKRKNKKHKGFRLRHGVMCGSGKDDVVENVKLLIKERRMPEKEVVSFQRLTISDGNRRRYP